MSVRFLAALLSCVTVVLPATALTILPATFDELVRESTAVVYGRVVSVQGTWTPDRRTIESVVTLEALEHFKGTETSTTTFTVPGGTAGGRILVMPGAPTFRPGDAVVVFLRGTAPAMPSPVGLSLGVYRVASSPRDGTLMVVPTPITTAAGDGTVRRGSVERAPRSLARFGAEVRAAVGAAK